MIFIKKFILKIVEYFKKLPEPGMTFHLLIPFTGVTVFAVIFLSVFFSNTKNISFYRDSDRILSESSLIEYEGERCWIKGVFIPENESGLLTSPITKNKCIYYHYLKEEELESDDSTYWSTIDEDIKIIDFYFKIGNKKLLIDKDNINIEKGTRRVFHNIETIKNGKFRTSEYIIPYNNNVWILGIPQRLKVKPIEKNVIISFINPDEYIEYIKDENSNAFGALILGSIFIVISLVFLLIFIRRLIPIKIISMKRTFQASADKLYNFYMNANQHSKILGSKVEVKKSIGSSFYYEKEFIAGKILYLNPGRMIVQTWCKKYWDKENLPSIVTIIFNENKYGITLVNLFHTNVPVSNYFEIKKYWKKKYFKQWKKLIREQKKRS